MLLEEDDDEDDDDDDEGEEEEEALLLLLFVETALIGTTSRRSNPAFFLTDRAMIESSSPLLESRALGKKGSSFCFATSSAMSSGKEENGESRTTAEIRRPRCLFWPLL